jgi:hypothetical protein
MRRLPVLIAPDGSVAIKSLVGMLVLADPLPATRLRPAAATPAHDRAPLEGVPCRRALWLGRPL